MKSGRKAVWVALCLLVVSVVLLAVFLFVESRGKAGVLHAAWAPSVDGQTMAALLVDETGFAMDPEYLSKKTHVSWARNVLDLQKAGIRRTDAVVIQEVSCL